MPGPGSPARPIGYAELHCVSNFSFLRGASHPEELVQTAAALGYEAIAVTDDCSVSGAVRAHQAGREHGIHVIHGAEFTLAGGPRVVLLATDRRGWAQLCGLITRARRRADKGHYRLHTDDLCRSPLDRCLLLYLPGTTPDDGFAAVLRQHFADRAWLAVELLAEGRDRERLRQLRTFAADQGLRCVAAGDVHMHRRGRRALQDTLCAIRHGRPLGELGTALFANGERHLRPLESLRRHYPPELLAETLNIARRCRFSLEELRHEYPHELVPDGHTPTSWLRRLTEDGAAQRYAGKVPDPVRRLIDHELALIAELRFEFYFLTVHDIVAWARRRGILCQGRGSAANSAVCYCLGITEVNPAEQAVLFERFISRERNEPPDIDVDFEHQRREEVIQYIYRKYGRDRAALAATVITYRPRSAIRDVGKALGLDADAIDALARQLHGWDSRERIPEHLAAAGLAPDSPVVRRLLARVDELIGFPRHLSQHVGGFLISQGPVHALVPVENAAMPERTVIQWEKDDLEALGLLKVDVLALGMLSAVRRCFDLLEAWSGRRMGIADIPRDDPATYRMIQRGDTVGVFQIESRAQMAMLPRLKPERFYDLVIEVAIVRPGPIQGDMVHPYLERRAGRAPVDYPSEAVRRVLERTLGVPIFQEQVMQLAMVAAGFTAGEADALRRAMAAWKKRGGLEPFERKLKDGMRARGYSAEFADRIYCQILGFGDYGFPESHAVSFALLAYVSAWLKCHHPAAFTAALLNSLPMGFYGPWQLIQDARRHGVEVRPVCVQHSRQQTSLEPGPDGRPAIRLGLDRIKGLAEEHAARLVAARGSGYASVADLAERAALPRAALERLADAGALASLSRHRHRALWETAGVEAPLPLLGTPCFAEAEPLLRRPREGEDLLADFRTQSATLGRHPLSLLRPRLARRGIAPSRSLQQRCDGDPVHVAGIVINRQRPQTAAGVMFMTLEDEDGPINLIVWPKVAERFRRALLGARLVAVTGTLQRAEGVTHVIARSARDHSDWLGGLPLASRDFC